MASKGIWYVGFPTYQYNEDVEALAKEADLRILDARFDAGDGAEEVPELTLKEEFQSEETDPVESFDVFKVVDGKRAERASKYSLTAEEAAKFVAENPENAYEVVADEG